MNPSIQRIIIGKTEAEAIAILSQFGCNWRIAFRNKEQEQNLTKDRDDRRYNLVMQNGKVQRVFAG